MKTEECVVWYFILLLAFLFWFCLLFNVKKASMCLHRCETTSSNRYQIHYVEKVNADFEREMERM